MGMTSSRELERLYTGYEMYERVPGETKISSQANLGGFIFNSGGPSRPGQARPGGFRDRLQIKWYFAIVQLIDVRRL